MELLLLAVVLLALRGSASGGTGNSGPAPGQTASGGKGPDVAGAAIGAIGAAVPTIASLFGGGSATAGGSAALSGGVGGAAAGAGVGGAFGSLAASEAAAATGGAIAGAATAAATVADAVTAGSAVLSGITQGAASGAAAAIAGGEATAVAVDVGATGAATAGEAAGLTLASVASVLGPAALIAAWFALAVLWIAVGGPATARVYEAAKEWGRRRLYGKGGVIASLDLNTAITEQDICQRLLSNLGPNLFTCSFSADPAANASPADVISRIDWVSPTVDLELQRSIARFARVLAIEQMTAKNIAIATFFTATKGQSDAQNEANGVALSGASFLAWEQNYCATRKFTSWGVNLNLGSPPVGHLQIVSKDIHAGQFTWEGMQGEVVTALGALWTRTRDRFRFYGYAAGASMCSTEGYSSNWPGEDNFTVGINVYCGLGWTKFGLWLVDPLTNGAFNPVQSRQFASPQTVDAHLIDRMGSRIGNSFGPLGSAYLQSLNPPVDAWV